MAQVTVKTPFIMRIGGENVLFKKGTQELTQQVIEHAEKHGFLTNQKAAEKADTKGE
ncbi:hypothetical protein VQ643_09485 [Pseudomonas sp. F1_0610]|uniref:hypothetical protein n=1 Tax=Pseudomonas sp. F1_0610 TaxID=3114284 RepID=UPI0039C1C430